jgi:hypothetical protein
VLVAAVRDLPSRNERAMPLCFAVDGDVPLTRWTERYERGAIAR